MNLGDGVSAPAGSAAQQVGALTKQMQGLQAQMTKTHDSMQGAGASVKDSGSKMEGAAASAEMLEAASFAAAAAVVALGVAAVAGGAALSVMAGESRQAFEAMSNAMAGSEAAGAKVSEMVDHLAQTLPVAKDRLRELTGAFMAAGLRDVPRLEKALRAVATATALSMNAAKVEQFIKKTEMFAEAGKNFKAFAKTLQGTGVNEGDLAKKFGLTTKELERQLKVGKISAGQLGDAFQDALIAKGANAVEVANNRLGVMFDKMKTGAMEIFDGVVETPGYKDFIHAIQQIGIIFGIVGGDAKKHITGAFGAIFGIMAKVLTFGIIYGLKFATMLVKMYIATFPLLKKLHEWWNMTKQSKTFQNAMQGLIMVFKILGGIIAFIALRTLAAFLISMAAIGWVIGAVVTVFKALWNIIIGVAAEFWSGLIGAFVAVYEGAKMIWKSIKESVGKALGYLSDLAAKGFKLASDFVAGLVLGLTGGMKPVGDLSAKLGAAMEKGAKASIEAHSPSRVAMEIGRMFGSGLEVGLDASGSGVHAEAKALGGMAAGGAAAGGGGGGKGDINITVEKGAIQINAGGKGVTELTEEAFADLLERLLMQQGGFST